jgi:hypothetical protein
MPGRAVFLAPARLPKQHRILPYAPHAGPAGDQVFTLQGAETPYRFLVETRRHGEVARDEDGRGDAISASSPCVPPLPLN